MDSIQNILIIFVLFVIVLIIVFNIDIINPIKGMFILLFKSVLSFFGLIGYSLGATINKSAEFLATLFKTIIDIFKNVIQRIGTIFIVASAPTIGISSPQTVDQPETKAETTPEPKTLSKVLNEIAPPKSTTEPQPQWCYLGKHNGTAGCIKIDERDKCMSNQIFPSQKLCLVSNK